jgi:thiosulfate/3-mercaptopyruvate sulfurtransferase
VSDLPSIVDVAWLEAELGADDLFLGDVRGPNAHARGHIPGSRPLVLGSPPPMSDPEMLQALAPEVGLRLRRHGVTGDERLVLYDRGDGVGAMPAVQMAELAGHPRVAVLRGGIAAWSHELEVGQVELHPVKTTFEPRFDAIPTRAELAGRLDDETLMILDVRTEDEFRGKHGYPCDPRQGRIPGARHVPVEDLFAGPGQPLPADQIRARVGDPNDIVAYCHSGSRSSLATFALRTAGYRARNYAGSWHEWSRHDDLPLERG